MLGWYAEMKQRAGLGGPNEGYRCFVPRAGVVIASLLTATYTTDEIGR